MVKYNKRLIEIMEAESVAVERSILEVIDVILELQYTF